MNHLLLSDICKYSAKNTQSESTDWLIIVLRISSLFLLISTILVSNWIIVSCNVFIIVSLVTLSFFSTFLWQDDKHKILKIFLLIDNTRTEMFYLNETTKTINKTSLKNALVKNEKYEELFINYIGP